MVCEQVAHVISFLPSLENCGCYGNGNSQNVAKHMDPDIIQKRRAA